MDASSLNNELTALLKESTTLDLAISENNDKLTAEEEDLSNMQKKKKRSFYKNLKNKDKKNCIN